MLTFVARAMAYRTIFSKAGLKTAATLVEDKPKMFVARLPCVATAEGNGATQAADSKQCCALRVLSWDNPRTAALVRAMPLTMGSVKIASERH